MLLKIEDRRVHIVIALDLWGEKKQEKKHTLIGRIIAILGMVPYNNVIFSDIINTTFI